jgi:hypothetical protein
VDRVWPLVSGARAAMMDGAVPLCHQAGMQVEMGEAPIQPGAPEGEPKFHCPLCVMVFYGAFGPELKVAPPAFATACVARDTYCSPLPVGLEVSLPQSPRPTRLAPRLARLLRFKGSVMGSLRPAFAVLLCAVAFLCGNARAAPEPQPFGPGSLEAIRLAHQGRAFILSLWSVSCEAVPPRDAGVARAAGEASRAARGAGVDRPAHGARSHQALLERYDPGPVQSWHYATNSRSASASRSIRKWRGEMPRTYYFDAQHRVEARTGVPDPQWLERWVAKAGAS